MHADGAALPEVPISHIRVGEKLHDDPCDLFAAEVAEACVEDGPDVKRSICLKVGG
jgi:hypothetical protein